MNKLENQRGFATLEILLVVAIIAIFSTITLPRVSYILNKTYLDYELKHLYSDLIFARSIGKSSTFNGGFFELEDSQNKIEFWIYGRKYSNVSARNRYQIMRPSVTSSPYYRHNLAKGVELGFKNGNALQKITFNNRTQYDNWSKTLEFSLNQNRVDDIEAEIIFDSVGRWRGTYK